MKKILCLVMAAVLAVVMMAPMEARASSGYVEGTDIGAPSVVSSSDYMYGTAWDYFESPEMNDGSYWYTNAYKDYVQFVTIDISNGWRNSGYLPYYTLNAPITLRFNTSMNLNVNTEMSVSVIDVQLMGDVDGVLFSQSSMSDKVSNSGADNSLFRLDTNFGGYIMLSVPEPIRVGSDASNVITLKVKYRLSVYSTGDYQKWFPDAPAVTMNAEVASWGKTYFYNQPTEKTWFDSVTKAVTDWGINIVSSVNGFKDQVGSWFQTQWTFGRQWTDDIIDAIVGQSGGGSIGTAQDELDNQLNSIENVEQQLSDQVLDKVDVPSISLSSDETGGLNWVVSTINSFYVAFDELHVMFACVVFFSICAVLLFGRRNL